MKRIFTITMFMTLFAVAGICLVNGQNSAVSGPDRLKTEAEIGKVIRGYYDAYNRRDAEAVASAWTDDGFVYLDGYSTNIQSKAETTAWLKSPAAAKAREGAAIEDLRIVIISKDTGFANYTLITTFEQDGKTNVIRAQTTNVLFKRNGRWQIALDHTSKLPTPVEATVSGIPVGWRRTPANSSNGYSVTVDTNVKHDGRASATIKYSCPGDTDFGSIGQSIIADDYRGKRVRLSGWLKTEKADAAGLWLRIDGDGRTLNFDNMLDRAARDTTDWKRYEIVLDVPAEAVNIVLGSLISGKGQVWIDDLKLDVVGTDVPSTNQLTPEQIRAANPRTLKKSDMRETTNLGFEGGIVP